MLHAMDNRDNQSLSPNNVSPALKGKRRPMHILTGIFTRNKRESGESSEDKDTFYLADDLDMWESLSDGIPEPREALHSPYHARTIDQDMQNLRLSREDNPFLQVLASRECLNDSDDGSEYEEKNLMCKETINGQSRDPLSLEEVHARLVRSPPPVWTRSRSSEPSFSHSSCSQNASLGAEFVFQFPPHNNAISAQTAHNNSRTLSMEPSPTHYCRTHASSMPQGHSKFLCPFKKENALEMIAAKFNLSPQPRRKPNLKSHPFSDFSSSS